MSKKRKGNSKKRTRVKAPKTNALARAIAPEDLRRGDYIAVARTIVELLPTCWEPEVHGAPRTTPVALLPWRVIPLRVEAVCLPLVLVAIPTEGRTTVDARRFQFVRLGKKFGRYAFERMKA